MVHPKEHQEFRQPWKSVGFRYLVPGCSLETVHKKTWLQPKVTSSDISWDVGPLLCCSGDQPLQGAISGFSSPGVRPGWYLRLPTSSLTAHINQISTSKAVLENPNSSRDTFSPCCSHICHHLKKKILGFVCFFPFTCYTYSEQTNGFCLSNWCWQITRLPATPQQSILSTLCLLPSLPFFRLSFTNTHFHTVKEKAAPLLTSELIVHDRYLVQTKTDWKTVCYQHRQLNLKKNPLVTKAAPKIRRAESILDKTLVTCTSVLVSFPGCHVL